MVFNHSISDIAFALAIVCQKAKEWVVAKGPVWQIGANSYSLAQRSLVMGILNITPDSFSDGGLWLEPEEALRHAQRMVEEGANLIDVGGESTRPGSDAVLEEEEKRRVLPVVERLASDLDVPVSIDTRKPVVAAAALERGARVVNDISGLRDPEMVKVCAGSDCGVVVMHMKGEPKTMQKEPHYDDVLEEVFAYFQERYETLTTAGIAAERLCWDPGIGFGKRLEDNLSLISRVDELAVAGRPVMMGLSRKSFIGKLLGQTSVAARKWSTIGLTAWTREQGALVHRVHDVKENVEALRLVEAI